jgi:large subunit ribosomal protein L23
MTVSNINSRNDHRLLQLIERPVISEKATFVAEKYNQVLFKVSRDATKQEIKQALENIFKVEVLAVNVVNRKGKEKRFGKHQGRRDHQRFAYVSLKPGQEFNLETEIK